MTNILPMKLFLRIRVDLIFNFDNQFTRKSPNHVANTIKYYFFEEILRLASSGVDDHGRMDIEDIDTIIKLPKLILFYL